MINTFYSEKLENIVITKYCVKSVRSFFWSLFSCIRSEHGDLLRKSLYSVRIQEDADQKNSAFGHFLRSAE